MPGLFKLAPVLGQWVQSLYKPPESRPRACIIHMPVDIVYQITQHLDKPSCQSLALMSPTLRAMNAFYGTPFRKMRREEQRATLLLLERDQLFKGLYYCHSCHTMHKFHEFWGPRSTQEWQTPMCCATRSDRFAPSGNAYGLAFTHARLVMNHHLYGPEHGLPIESICVEHTASCGAVQIECKTDARILDGELFVKREYEFRVSDRTAASFRNCFAAGAFGICRHTSLFKGFSVHQQWVPEVLRSRTDGTLGLVPCTNVPGSCRLCLMDYDVTIGPCPASTEQPPEGRRWLVTMRAYHQLGACREATDWKWCRFAETETQRADRPHEPNRTGSEYAPGCVKKRWMGDDRAREEERAALKWQERNLLLTRLVYIGIGGGCVGLVWAYFR